MIRILLCATARKNAGLPTAQIGVAVESRYSVCAGFVPRDIDGAFGVTSVVHQRTTINLHHEVLQFGLAPRTISLHCLLGSECS